MRKLFTVLIASFALSAQVRAVQPKLVVAIIVDQMRYDYLERFHHQFSSNGFRLLMDRGAFMTFAHYNYIPTVTGPGHACFLSGSVPMIHGIIGNDWYDRKSGKDVNCVEDESVDGVGATAGKGRASPKNFIGDSLADEMRLRYRSKVVGLSIKDRGAILPAGKRPTGAYWFYSKNGNFITSSYYMEQLPAWVQDFNKRKRPADFATQTWKRLLNEKEYLNKDEQEGEGTLAEEKKPVFDHKIAPSKDNFDNVLATPFSNQLLEEFAEAAVEGEKLGRGEQPDLLSVSFSAIDAVGHKFGPHSQEVQDSVVRLDRDLEKFFNFLETTVGLQNVLITLTADHGVAATPEFAKAEGIDVPRVDETEFLNDLKQQLAEEFGNGRYLQSSKLYTGNLYLNHATLEKKHLDIEKVSSFIREFALKSGKFQACYTREQLLDGRTPGPYGPLAMNGYNAERGGDLILIGKPFSIPGTGKTGTTHGSPYSYDSHVPVAFYGASFKPGRYPDQFYITDIAPTLCAVLRLNEPAGSIGKPFKAALVED
jgi:predicted AlkP superfamily pyrophosphatase or phosphodiesterase